MAAAVIQNFISMKTRLKIESVANTTIFAKKKMAVSAILHSCECL